MIKTFLHKKYGSHITNQLLTSSNEVIWDNYSKDSTDQLHVRNQLLQLGDLIPSSFIEDSVEWGMDFSSWIGEFNTTKEYFFIGAEPHLNKDFQLVYDFGNRTGKTLSETAKFHYDRQNDIWYYLTNIFIDETSDENITEFLSKCYITDLCHLVPKTAVKFQALLKDFR